jgi:hypothetical protein
MNFVLRRMLMFNFIEPICCYVSVSMEHNGTKPCLVCKPIKVSSYYNQIEQGLC